MRKSLSFLAAFIILLSSSVFASEPNAGFFLPVHVQEMTFRYHTINNLIVLPVTINDSIKVNLILDTGCRNLVLFGKQFQKKFHVDPTRKIQFSGLGNGKPVNGKLALNNKVSIHAVLGEQIPVVLVESKNLFSAYSEVHGIIGYDIFIKFEIELNAAKHLITFRPAGTAELATGFERIPLRITDARPLIQSHVFFNSSEGEACELMIDTGSTLGLLVKTSDLKKFPKGNKKIVLGRGLNGDITGIEVAAEKLHLEKFEIKNIFANIIYSEWQTYASVGMDIMKNYTVVLNYCKAYAGFKKTDTGNFPTTSSQTLSF
jgi:hypothetical protein